ncbi:hypothetical protein QJQ45_029642 [Haematococcus lacustris]|nr:hypothetical protein QJQ45_029642 [Haematococcus lacustris]
MDPVVWCQDPVVWCQDPVGQNPVDPVAVVRCQDPVVRCQDPVSQNPVVRCQDPVGQDPVVWCQDPVGQNPVDPVVRCQDPVVRCQDPVVMVPGPCSRGGCQDPVDPVVWCQDPVVPGPCGVGCQDPKGADLARRNARTSRPGGSVKEATVGATVLHTSGGMSEAREEGELDQGAPDFTKKHPLEQSWTLWFDNPTAKQTINKFGQTLKEVYTFDTVEDFWCLYNNIKTPGQLQPSATFMLFKQGIHPKWEDPKNEHGGCWTASLNKGTSTVKQQIDAWWLNSVRSGLSTGFSISWCSSLTGDVAGAGTGNQIGRKLKEFLDIPDSMKIGYCVFKDKINNQKAKDKYSC